MIVDSRMIKKCGRGGLASIILLTVTAFGVILGSMLGPYFLIVSLDTPYIIRGG